MDTDTHRHSLTLYEETGGSYHQSTESLVSRISNIQGQVCIVQESFFVQYQTKIKFTLFIIDLAFGAAAFGISSAAWFQPTAAGYATMAGIVGGKLILRMTEWRLRDLSGEGPMKKSEWLKIVLDLLILADLGLWSHRWFFYFLGLSILTYLMKSGLDIYNYCQQQQALARAEARQRILSTQEQQQAQEVQRQIQRIDSNSETENSTVFVYTAEGMNEGLEVIVNHQDESLLKNKDNENMTDQMISEDRMTNIEIEVQDPISVESTLSTEQMNALCGFLKENGISRQALQALLQGSTFNFGDPDFGDPEPCELTPLERTQSPVNTDPPCQVTSGDSKAS